MSPDILQERASQLGIPDPRNITSTALIRRIQMRLGQEPCCGTDHRYTCQESDCPWRHACQRLVAAWQR